MTATLFYFHDPMCSWCWGYQTAWQGLLQDMPDDVNVAYVLGGLAQDNDELMPEDIQQAIQGHWRRIQDELGVEFNFDFWRYCQPRRSTYPACRAVIAAGKQDAGVTMILAIQHAYYLRAMNPSKRDTLCTLAQELGLDIKKFNDDFDSDEIEESLQEQIRYSRSVGVGSFPSLMLKNKNELYRLTVDYKNHETTLNQIIDILR
ncbi:MAG: DsbA family protein [Gammaproteobacteria bacterium]|nr:DsbA family protein [Beggiatoa alba]PCH61596.1 MAG: DsbA family protein [Gammaproteobacteria bacterium]